jgi:hypothetical protein
MPNTVRNIYVLLKLKINPSLFLNWMKSILSRSRSLCYSISRILLPRDVFRKPGFNSITRKIYLKMFREKFNSIILRKWSNTEKSKATHIFRNQNKKRHVKFILRPSLIHLKMSQFMLKMNPSRQNATCKSITKKK